MILLITTPIVILIFAGILTVFSYIIYIIYIIEKRDKLRAKEMDDILKKMSETSKKMEELSKEMEETNKEMEDTENYEEYKKWYYKALQINKRKIKPNRLLKYEKRNEIN
jgi:uncharacterized protein YlxW (UPF0749 family)